MRHKNQLQIGLVVNDDGVQATLHDTREETRELFASLDEAQQATLAEDAWTVGLKALTTAYRHAEEARLGDIGQSLVADVDQQLANHLERHQLQLVQLFQRYFDPKDGQVAQRIDSFVRDGGDLTHQLERYFAPESGKLARTLAQQLGESSPLLRRLSPTDSQGVLSLFEKKIEQVLQQNNAQLAHALDPLAENGAMARLFRSLREELAKSDQDRDKQLAVATKALDANDETSLLSRLMRETQAARTSMLRAFNVDKPGSPLFTLKAALCNLLGESAKQQAESLALFEERQRKLDQDIRESLARLEERKRGEARSPRGGFSFEEAVIRFVQRAVQGAPIIAEATGCSAGVGRSRVGDQVLRYTAESLFEGATIVVEAKRDLSYTETKALRELEEARANRSASVGLFVMARSHAPVGFPTFVRRGQDVLVTWDPEDDTSDPYLLAAICLAMALVTRTRAQSDDADLKALADIEKRLNAELARQEKMKKIAENIRKQADDLYEELRKGGDKLAILLRNSKKTLKALDVELAHDETEAQERLGVREEVFADLRAERVAAE
jgi:hypothetical protein